MRIFGKNDDANTYQDASPDLRNAIEGGRRNYQKNRSTNPIVQKALDYRIHDNESLLSSYLGDHREFLRHMLGLDPSQEMLNLYQTLSEEDRKLFLQVWRVIKQTFSNKSIPQLLGVQQYEDVIGLRDIEYSNREAEFREAIKESHKRIDSLKKESDSLSNKIQVSVQNAQNKVSQSVKSLIDDADGKLKNFISSHTVKCEDLESKLREYLSRATIGRLSKQFEEKCNSLNLLYKKTQKFFYGSLIAFSIIGLLSVCFAHLLVTPELEKTYGLLSFVVNMPRALVQFLPFYIPLFWYTCHVNRLMNQHRRLMEEYAHKTVVAQTYMGLSEQVEELEKKGVRETKVLSQDLLDRTVQVLCVNPNESLDKVKSQTPISEIVNSVVKLVRTTADVKGTKHD